MEGFGSAEVQRRAARIRCLFLDIDGVMTDCKLYLTPDGEELKAVNVRDGWGIKALMRHGVEVAVISGRPSAAMEKRLQFLGLRHVVLDTEVKLPAYERIRDSLGLTDEECAMMGDDVPDLPLLERVGLAMVPSDAHRRAMERAHYVSTFRGGEGAIRDAADLLLDAKGIVP
jgi:3-deoxy-D-manno-octulosonate 8-phosphate phosphatase (KDO 8-P phosphatase)